MFSHSLPRLYLGIILTLRLLLALYPPTYIHPDEFFQSQEVVAGSMFGSEVFVPWEFQSNVDDKKTNEEKIVLVPMKTKKEVVDVERSTDKDDDLRQREITQRRSPPSPPSRTIVTPGFTSGLPFAILRLLSSLLFSSTGASGSTSLLLSGRALLYAPRLLMTIITIIIDYVVLTIVTLQHSPHDVTLTSATTIRPPPPRAPPVMAMFLLSTSWVSLTFFPRPFSNTCETLVLAVAFGLLLLRTPGRTRSVSLGCVLAVGTFTRFTFVLFFFPLGIALLLQHDSLSVRVIKRRAREEGSSAMNTKTKTKMETKTKTKTMLSTTTSTTWFRLQSVGHVIFDGFMGALLTSCFFVIVDSWYFHQLTITPLNNALYNMNSNNLAEHGLHPRWLHSVVNMHVLFGPLATTTYAVGVIRALQWWRERRRIPTIQVARGETRREDGGEEGSGGGGGGGGVRGGGVRDVRGGPLPAPSVSRRPFLVDPTTCTINVEILCLLCVASGLGFLSLAPHQEARFLLPLFVPVLIVSSSFLIQSKKFFQKIGTYRLLLVVILLFNGCLLMLFGVLHQGGLLRSLLHLEHLKITTRSSYRAYYFKTHMAPRFMLNNQKNHAQDLTDQGYCEVVDLTGEEITELKSRLVILPSATGSNVKNLVIAPKSVKLEDDVDLSKCLHLLTEYWPHLSMEDFPHSFSELSLQIFEQTAPCVDEK